MKRNKKTRRRTPKTESSGKEKSVTEGPVTEASSTKVTVTQAAGRHPGSNKLSDQQASLAHASASEVPPPILRLLLPVWAILHVVLVFVSFVGVVEPSGIVQAINELSKPYLRPTHFSANDRPVFLTHGDAADWPYRLQISDRPISQVGGLPESGWRDSGEDISAGLAASDRRARWLSTAAILAINEQPGLVAELVAPILVKHRSAKSIRIMRYPTDLSNVDELASPVYVASVLRPGDSEGGEQASSGSISLIELKESRLSTSVETDSAASASDRVIGGSDE